MAFTFTACAPKQNKTSITIGLLQLVEHPSLDEIRTAFTAQLEKDAKANGLDIVIDYQNGQGDPTIINSICQKFVGNKVSLIVAIATPAAQGAANAITGTDIPLVFSAVTDPVAAGLVENLQAPEGNITGTSDAIPVEDIFKLALELTPNIKTVGTVYSTSEANSKVVVQAAKEYLEKNGMELVESAVTSVGEVQTAIQGLKGKCDAVFIPIDNTVATAMETLSQEAIAMKMPVYAAADSLVNDGALASYGVNYTELGQKTAEMSLKVLQGAKISDIPVEVMKNNSVTVNSETAQAIGVDVSKYAK